MNPQQNPPADWTAVLEQLQRIAGALEKPPEQVQEITEAVLATATSNIDYLAVRQLMGRLPRDREPVAIFPATCDRTGTHPVLRLTEVPPKTGKVAVFTARGEPAQVLEIPEHEEDFGANKKPIDYQLDKLSATQGITRVEFRRDNNLPLGLARRFPA